MSWKTAAEVETSFRLIEGRLDAMLEECCQNLVNDGILLHEKSNRTGFGGHSYTSFIWSFHFEKRQADGSQIKRATTQLTYREPLMEDEPQAMEVTSVAEIFQTGQPSLVREIREMLYLIDQFLRMKMDLVIIECLTAAEHILTKN